MMTPDQYQQALQRHDWHFEFSDDGLTYRAGLFGLKALRAAQPVHDPLFRLWNQSAPQSHQQRVTADQFIAALRAQRDEMLAQEA